MATISFCGRPLAPSCRRSSPAPAFSPSPPTRTTPAAAACSSSRRVRPLRHARPRSALAAPANASAPSRASDAPPRVAAAELLAIEVVPGPEPASCPSPPGFRMISSSTTARSPNEKSARSPSPRWPRAGELLWDIGCGSGSVAIEWALRGNTTRHRHRGPARPRRPRRPQRAGPRRDPASSCVRAARPKPSTGLARPTPSSSAAAPRPPSARNGLDGPPTRRTYVANAVALDSASAARRRPIHARRHVTRIAIERLDQIGTMRAMRPAMPVPAMGG